MDATTLNNFCLAGKAFLVQRHTEQSRPLEVTHIGIGPLEPNDEKVNKMTPTLFCP